MMKKIIHYSVVTILAFFGLLTLFLSSSIIFDLFGIRAREGNYVLFIVWSNFICSFMYLIAVYGLLTTKKWTYKVLALSSVILFIAFVSFLFYIYSGGLHESKTVGAMIFRMVLTFGFTIYAYLHLSRTQKA